MGGSVDEMDLMMRMLQKNGCEVTAVTVFSDFNDIDRPLPYEVKKENIGFRDCLVYSGRHLKFLESILIKRMFFKLMATFLLYAAAFIVYLAVKCRHFCF